MAKKNRPAPGKPAPTVPAQKSAPTTVTPVSTAAVALEAAGWIKWALIALLITGVCYLPILKNSLVSWDDNVNIVENPNLQQINSESLRNIFDLEKGAVIGNYNPLAIFTFALEKMAVGTFNDSTYWLIYLDNLILHLLTVFFAMRLLLHMGIGARGAFIGGLLFGIHPMRVESVAWATERKDVLFAMFFFAALMYYVRWIKTADNGKRTRYYLIMLLLMLLSCLSKVQAVTLPLSMLVLDYWFRRPLSLKLILEKTPFWLLSLTFGLLNLYTLGKAGSTAGQTANLNLPERLCIGAYSFCVYLCKLFVPHPMAPMYPYPQPLPTQVYLAPVLFLVIWGGIYWLWKKDRRIWVFAAMFFFFNVMFLLQVFGAGQGFLADRFTYVPYFGFFALAAWAFDHYGHTHTKLRIPLYGLACVVFAVYAFLTYRQIGIWKNSDTLWAHVLKYQNDPSLFVVDGQLMQTKIKEGFTGNKEALLSWNQGQSLREKGQLEEAIREYSNAIKIEPGNPEYHNSRGKTYFDLAMSGKQPDKKAAFIQKSIDDYSQGLGLPTENLKLRSRMLINRGSALASQGKFQQALQDFNEGINADSTNKAGYLNRSLVFLNMGDYAKAIADYTEYLKIEPNDANIWFERGMLRRYQNQFGGALDDLNRALQLNPNLGNAYLERARVHAQTGNKAAALNDYRQAQKFGLQQAEYDLQLMKK